MHNIISELEPDNFQLLEKNDNNVQFLYIKPNVSRISAQVNSLIQMAAQNGGMNYNIYIKSILFAAINVYKMKNLLRINHYFFL